jgi:hypothetical protein
MSWYTSAAERPQPLPMMARVTRSMRLHRAQRRCQGLQVGFSRHVRQPKLLRLGLLHSVVIK